MERLRIKRMIEWKNSTSRKPLIIRGARQTGKTWLMQEFGKRHYSNVAYLNLEKNVSLASVFEQGYDTKRIIAAIELATSTLINPDNTLIIIDEIQAIPKALTSLKYFCEDAPEYHVIAAGSLLGVALHADVSFPVGKVDFMDLYPLNFTEFLYACGDERYAEIISKQDWEFISAFKDKIINRLKEYYFTGGMPEAVKTFIEGGNFEKVRDVQKSILNAYELDFSKHAPALIVPRIRMLWNSILGQLAKENKKFIYGLVKVGSRAKEYEGALSWLIDCGQVYKIHRVSKPGIPLKSYEDLSAFKLFIVDVGLLGAMGTLDPQTLLSGSKIFTEFKGALTEQFTLQQLISEERFVINYWSSDNTSAEIDFLIQHKNDVYPLEVKAEENLHAKSLRVYSEKFQPTISYRTSLSDYRQQDWLINHPLYAINTILKPL